MSSFIGKLRTKTRLNIFITGSMFLTVAISQLLAGALFYFSSERALTRVYREEVMRRLEQINRSAHERIVIIDSMYPLFMSNTIIRENLDPVTPAYRSKGPIERRLEIERQMSYMIVTSYLWTEGLVNAVYIFDTLGNHAGFSPYKSPEQELIRARTVYHELDRSATGLKIKRGAAGQSIYFIKNVFSMYTGEKIAAILIDINGEKWKTLHSAGTDENWLVLMYSGDLLLNLGRGTASPEETDGIVALSRERAGFQENTLRGTDYFIASQKTGYADLVSVVAAPRQNLLRDMRKTLRVFIVLYLVMMLASLVFTTLISVSVTSPIKKMTAYVRAVSGRHTGTRRPEGMFAEFEEFAAAFTEMLGRMEMYYTGLRHQQLLLKNAEIKALRSQIAPHFLFNVLNTIAWKAEISGNTEIYQMTIMLSELLRANILSNDQDFVSLKEELDYARFYIELQQRRFEDKFTVEMVYDDTLSGLPVPRFSIQPLVENAIAHGLEPLSAGGRLAVRVLPERDGVYVEVEDNGAGFPDDFDINAALPPEAGSHTRVGLKNLNQRLILLGGAESALSIRSGTEGRTVVSFKIPDAARRAREADEASDECSPAPLKGDA